VEEVLVLVGRHLGSYSDVYYRWECTVGGMLGVKMDNNGVARVAGFVAVWQEKKPMEQVGNCYPDISRTPLV